MNFRQILRGAALVGVILAQGLLAGHLAAGEPPALSYGFQKGRDYLYSVKIVADLPTEELTRDGVYTYKIVDAADNQFSVKVSGGLSEKIKAKPGMGMRFGPPFPHRFGPPAFPRFGQPMRPDNTTIGRQGNLIIEGNLTPLPFLLGYAEMLVIEPLPKEAKEVWNTETGLGVVERDQSWHHIGPFSATETARRVGTNRFQRAGDQAR